MVKKRKITEYSLKKSTEHLSYEIWMFYETLNSLRYSKNQKDINILLDSFTIHTRNLFDFFYPRRKNFKKDDMVVTDFITKLKDFNSSKTKKRDLMFIIRKADKQVAHLTYTRNRYNSKTKPWPFIDIGRKMYKTLNIFYNSLPNQYKKWPYIIQIKSILKNVDII